MLPFHGRGLAAICSIIALAFPGIASARDLRFEFTPGLSCLPFSWIGTAAPNEGGQASGSWIWLRKTTAKCPIPNGTIHLDTNTPEERIIDYKGEDLVIAGVNFDNLLVTPQLKIASRYRLCIRMDSGYVACGAQVTPSPDSRRVAMLPPGAVPASSPTSVMHDAYIDIVAMGQTNIYNYYAAWRH